MILTPNVSSRITLLRFPLIMAVVYLHGYLADEVQVDGVSRFFQEYLSQSLARIAVPLFFIISGYLLFQGYEPRFDVYKKKIASRVRTLLVPFVIWNVVKLLFLASIQSIPAFRSYVSSTDQPVLTYDAFDYFSSIFGVGRRPIAYQFWFIRDLMVLVVLSPAFLFLLRFVPMVSFAFFFLVWFIRLNLFLEISSIAVFFFFVGAMLSVPSFDLDIVDRKGKWFVVLLVLFTIFDALTKGCGYSLYLHNSSVLIGLCGVWALAGYMCENGRVLAVCSVLSSYAFFVYAAHQPTLKVIERLGFRFVSLDNDLSVTLLYLFIPTITIALTLSAGVVIKRVIPKVYGVVTGGR